MSLKNRKKSAIRNNLPKAEREFTDRTEPKEIFKNAFSNKKDYQILAYYGVGGIGKTRLQKELIKNYIKENEAYARIDFDNPRFRNPINTYKAIADDLFNNYKIKFPIFNAAYIIYLKKMNPDLEMKTVSLPFFEEGGLISDVVSIFSGSGVAAGAALKLTSYLVKKLKNITIDEETKQELINIESKNLIDIENDLVYFLGKDIENFLKTSSKRVIIFLDTYEALWEDEKKEANKFTKDEWIRQLVIELTGVLFVICGREKLIWDELDKDFKEALDQHKIGDLTKQDTSYFLDKCGIKDTDLQNAIYTASQGVPFYIDLCVDLYYESNENITPKEFEELKSKNEIGHRLIRYFSNDKLTKLRALSSPRFFDSEIYEYLLGETSHSIQNITDYSFFEKSENDGKLIYTMHKLV